MTHRHLPFALLGAFAVAPAQQFARQPIPQSEFVGLPPIPIDLDGDGDLDFIALTNNGQVATHFRNLGGSRFAPFAAPRLGDVSLPLDQQVPVADLDGDGDADMLLNSATGVALLQNTQGRLADSGIRLTTSPNAVPGIRRFDADRDGDIDVLIRTWSLALLLNDGAGRFSAAPPGMVPTVNGATVAEIADLDRDGAIDMLTVDNNVLQVFMTRAGTFVDETGPRLPTVSAPRQLSIADLDQDGDLDLTGVLQRAPSAPFLLRNDGSGRFTDITATLPAAPFGIATVLPIDVDGDGDRDLLAERSVLTNDGNGAFITTGAIDWSPLAAVDLDGDRWVDLLTRQGVARNEGNRGFRLLTRCNGVVAGDLDSDGDLDVLGTAASAWITEGGTLRPRAGMPNSSVLGRFVDLDGDGDVELIDSVGAIRIWANDGTGSLTLAWSVVALGIRLSAVAFFDLEGDGDIDLAWGSGTPSPTTPVVVRNDGNLAFTAVTATAMPAGTVFGPTIQGADLDGDGYDDLVTSSVMATGWLRNRGDGTFADASSRLPAGIGGQVVRAVQIDRDPELELLLVRDPVLFLLDRVGNDWVDATWRLPGSAGPATDAIPLDFDTDGDQDLAIAGGGGFLLQNDGNGVFTDVTRTHGPTTATPVTAFDADGDGDPDLLDGFDLWLTQQRQLSPAAPAAIGGALTLEYVGEPGFGSGASVCLVAIALRRSIAGMPLLGGTLLLDPTLGQGVGVMIAVGGTTATMRTPIPALPALTGLTLQLQGLVIGTRGELALANHLTVTID